MIQPKGLYRKLAALLANIENGKTKDHFLFSALRRMDNSFARDLHISNGRLFVEDHGQFLLAEFPDSQEPANLKTSVALDPDTMRRVIKNGSYIFSDRSLVQFHMEHGKAATVCTIPCEHEQAHRFGIIVNGQDGMISTFPEKPLSLEDIIPFHICPYASMGIYVFSTTPLITYKTAYRNETGKLLKGRYDE